MVARGSSLYFWIGSAWAAGSGELCSPQGRGPQSCVRSQAMADAPHMPCMWVSPESGGGGPEGHRVQGEPRGPTLPLPTCCWVPLGSACARGAGAWARGLGQLWEPGGGRGLSWPPPEWGGPGPLGSGSSSGSPASLAPCPSRHGRQCPQSPWGGCPSIWPGSERPALKFRFQVCA